MLLICLVDYCIFVCKDVVTSSSCVPDVSLKLMFLWLWECVHLLPMVCKLVSKYSNMPSGNLQVCTPKTMWIGSEYTGVSVPMCFRFFSSKVMFFTTKLTVLHHKCYGSSTNMHVFALDIPVSQMLSIIPFLKIQFDCPLRFFCLWI